MTKQNVDDIYNDIQIENPGYDLKVEFLKYISFWPWFLVSLLLFVLLFFYYVRYEDEVFMTNSTIEIIDKAQDSEMALPTAMTIFNRSMVNLENEITVIKSISIHEKTIRQLVANASYISVGRIKETIVTRDDWSTDFNFDFVIDIDSISMPREFVINYSNDFIKVSELSEGEVIQSYEHKNTIISNSKNNFPFTISLKENIQDELKTKKLILRTTKSTAISYIENLEVKPIGKDSDQLAISLKGTNPKIMEQYLNTLISVFDNDGIVDRQLSYKRTMDFVDSRSVFLKNELEKIELRKQRFKEDNSLSDIQVDANMNINQRLLYDSDLFKAESQLDLIDLLREASKIDDINLLPVNIGIDNQDLNLIISEHNILVNEREKFLMSAGSKNPYVKSIEKQINDLKKNIDLSINKYEKSLVKTIDNLKSKEFEFSEFFEKIPEKEKMLRAIERELEIKESLYLLLLQKREEAAINYAVVKPSIKIIEYAITDKNPISPNIKLAFLLALVAGLGIPFVVIYLVYLLDTKIHSRDDIIDLENVTIVGEIPFIDDADKITFQNKSANKDRSILSESFRMLLVNLNFTLFSKQIGEKNNRILVTSSVKGEGKTLISINTSLHLSSKFKKILLVGADLRNPQLHKYFSVDKEIKGLSNFIYSENNPSNWKDYINEYDNLDVIFSGPIPPNPTELLSSEKMKLFLEEVSKFYDYVVVDSAPCLLVSDSLEITKYFDTTLYAVRSNHTEKNIKKYIKDLIGTSKVNNLSIVLNGIGDKSSFDYKYGYNYSYSYRYSYSYNYGYGYGYNSDND